MNKASIYGFTLAQLITWMIDHGCKKSRAMQIWEWLYRKRAMDFSQMEDVSADCIHLMQACFTVQSLQEHCRQEAMDGTVKFLFKLSDGHLIETVLMKHKFGLSVCVTTQVGCNMGCSFCASGLLTKKRDLSSGEIVEQIVKTQQYLDRNKSGETISHVVVMGIGEPLDNFENLVNFLRVIQDYKGLAIGARHITVSTSGLADKIMEFADAQLGVNLAISLHAANNELRRRIMIINRAFPIERLMQAIDYYLDQINRKITLEYILLKDLNDQNEHALQLAELIGERKQRVTVNLIPYNPVEEYAHYQRSSKQTMLSFYDILKKHGIQCSIRLEHGTDIDAACGQLRSKQMKLTK